MNLEYKLSVSLNGNDTLSVVMQLNCPQKVVAVENIPWDVKKQDIVALFLSSAAVDDTWVHIPIELMSGKTKTELYVEVPTALDAEYVIQRVNGKLLGGRKLNVRISTYEELMTAFFPSLAHQELFTEADVHFLLECCTDSVNCPFKRSPHRPFEHILSMIRLLPWYKMDRKASCLFKLLLEDSYKIASYGDAEWNRQLTKSYSQISVSYMTICHMGLYRGFKSEGSDDQQLLASRVSVIQRSLPPEPGP